MNITDKTATGMRLEVSTDEARHLLRLLRDGKQMRGQGVDSKLMMFTLQAALDNAEPATATVEYGVFGYVLETVKIAGDNVHVLAELINAKTNEWARTLLAADNKDGDLRRYAPEFGNGYPSFGGFMPEFGENEFSGCLIDLKIGSRDIAYNEPVSMNLVAKTSLH